MTIDQNKTDQVNTDFIQRQNRYRRAWEAYYGKFRPTLKLGKDGIDDNVMVNYCRLSVDIKTAFLFGEPNNEIQFITDDLESNTTEAEAHLQAVWKANRKLTTLQEIALNGQICGNAYVKIQISNFQEYPRLIPLDPACVVPFWAHDDIRNIWKYVIEYDAENGVGGINQHRQTIWRDESGRWWIQDGQKERDKGVWMVKESVLWPYSFCPIFQCQNYVDPNVVWGMSDLEDDVLKLNRSINYILSNINRILRFNAHPKTWGRGFRSEQLKVAPNEMMVIEAPNGQLENLEMTSDLSSSINFYEAVRKSLRELTAVPEVALGGVEDPSRVSALALKVLYGPLLMQTGKKRITYGEMLSDLNSALLEIGGFGKDVVVNNLWPYVLPGDPYQEAQTALLDKQIGASNDTLLRKRGYNPFTEATNRANEETSIGAQILADFERGVGNA